MKMLKSKGSEELRANESLIETGLFALEDLKAVETFLNKNVGKDTNLSKKAKEITQIFVERVYDKTGYTPSRKLMPSLESFDLNTDEFLNYSLESVEETESDIFKKVIEVLRFAKDFLLNTKEDVNIFIRESTRKNDDLIKRLSKLDDSYPNKSSIDTDSVSNLFETDISSLEEYFDMFNIVYQNHDTLIQSTEDLNKFLNKITLEDMLEKDKFVKELTSFIIDKMLDDTRLVDYRKKKSGTVYYGPFANGKNLVISEVNGLKDLSRYHIYVYLEKDPSLKSKRKGKKNQVNCLSKKQLVDQTYLLKELLRQTEYLNNAVTLESSRIEDLIDEIEKRYKKSATFDIEMLEAVKIVKNINRVFNFKLPVLMYNFVITNQVFLDKHVEVLEKLR